MANTKSAAKRARQTATRTLRNRSIRTGLRRMQKQVASDGAAGGDARARSLVSAIDKAAKRGVIHRNAANRRKARLKRALLGGKSAAAPVVS